MSSHLSTIIQRVQDPPGDDGPRSKDVRNLREYVETWDDYSEKELLIAHELYKTHLEILDHEERKMFPQIEPADGVDY